MIFSTITLGNDGIAVSAGKVVFFKYKRGNQGEELVSDYKFRTEPHMLKFYAKSICHLAKNIFGVKIFSDDLDLSKH